MTEGKPDEESQPPSAANAEATAEKQRKKPVRYIAFYREEKTIYEAIEFNGAPRFLVYCKEDDILSIKDTIEREREVLRPAEKNMVPYEPYRLDQDTWDKLRNGDLDITKNSLHKEIYQIYDVFMDLESSYKALSAVTDIESYQQHKMNSISYLFYEGAQESGKTRALELHNFLCYRPLYGIDLPPADIYNYIGEENEALSSIIEDETELDKPGESQSEKRKIYRSGYTKGAKCPRILEGGSLKRTQKFYCTFCLKICAGPRLPKNVPLRQRFVAIPMVTGEPQKDEVEQADIDQTSNIRVRLLIWRMKTFFDPLPVSDVPLKGRLKQIWKGKILTAIGTDAEQTILDLAVKDRDRKLEAMKNTLEAFVLKALLDLGKQFEWHEIAFDIIWKATLHELDVMDYETYEGHEAYSDTLGTTITKQRLGRILSSAFHGEPNLRHKFGRTWKFNKETILKIAKKYGLELPTMENFKA